MSTRTTLVSVLLILLCGAEPARGQQPAALIAETPAAGPPVAEPLTLEGAIALALEANFPLRSARLEAEKYDDRLAALRTRRLPSFKVTALVTQPLTRTEFKFEKGAFGTFPETGPIPDEETSIASSMKPSALLSGQVTQPLSQLRRINLSIRQAEVSREMSREDLRLKRQSVVNEVKRAYYAALQTQSAFANAEAQIKLYRELDRVTELYVLQRVALKPDHMEVQTKLARAEYELLSLRNLLASQKEQLNHLLGRDVATEFAVLDGQDMAEYAMRETDLAAARRRALDQRPEISAARLKLRYAQYDRRIKKSEYIPDVSLSLNYLAPIGYPSIVPKNVAGVGVQVEWEVFDWGKKRRELAEKSLAVEQADNSVREAESAVLMEVNAQFRKLQESCQLLRIARMSRDTAVASAEVAGDRYRVQAAVLKDVLQAHAALADANHEYRKALLSFWTAKADFEKAIGEDK
ncbi:MAG TPA: TolC family protein [Pyrinomonadaceae bacterium]|nr:TolC family protein [Pyrinomonadaceae bacterium]